MKNLNLKKVSKLISQRLGREIELNEYEPIGGGYHSDGFRVIASDGEEFFIKKIKSNDLGFELPERKINSLLLSQEMSKRHDSHPSGVGVILKNKDGKKLLPDVNHETEIYHIQKFIPGYKKDQENYWQTLNNRKDKKEFNIDDKKEIEKIVNAISKIHKVKHASQDKENLNNVYNDGFRSILTSPELTFLLLHKYPDDNKILPRKRHEKFLGLMLKNIYKWDNRSDRLRALHGDFWGANLFIINDRAHLIDFSRIPWGDAAIDIGWWVSQYLWLYYQTANEYYKKSFEEFLDKYSKENNDKEIRQTIAPVLGIMGIIYTNPFFYPDLDLNIANKFMDNIWRILEKQEFTW